MQVSRREIDRAQRDLHSKVNAVVDSTMDTCQIHARRLCEFLQSNEVMKQIVEPLIRTDSDFTRFVSSRQNGGRLDRISIPEDTDEHIAFALWLLCSLSKHDDPKITHFAFTFFPSRSMNDSLSRFMNDIISPALEQLQVSICDYYEDMIDEDIELSAIKIFQFSSIGNNNNIQIGDGNVAINNVDIQQMPDRFLRILLDNGFTREHYAQLENEIQELREIIENKRNDEGSVKRILKKVLAVGGQAMLKLLGKAIEKPEIIAGLMGSIL